MDRNLQPNVEDGVSGGCKPIEKTASGLFSYNCLSTAPVAVLHVSPESYVSGEGTE